jgi:hypothetical protein
VNDSQIRLSDYPQIVFEQQVIVLMTDPKRSPIGATQVGDTG